MEPLPNFAQWWLDDRVCGVYLDRDTPGLKTIAKDQSALVPSGHESSSSVLVSVSDPMLELLICMSRCGNGISI